MTSKKEQIFYAVIEHIKKAGRLSNITVSEIAKLADMGKGTVYEYFSSKEEIIAETLIFLVEDFSNNISSRLDRSLKFEEMMQGHIKTVMEALLENANLHNLLMSQDIGGLINQELKCKITDKMFDLQRSYLLFLKSICDEGYKEGKCSLVTDEFILVAISNTIVSSSMHYYHNYYGKNTLSTEALIDKVYHIVLKIIS